MNDQAHRGLLSGRGAGTIYGHSHVVAGPMLGHGQPTRFQQQGNVHTIGGPANYGTASSSHQSPIHGRRVRNANDLSPEEFETIWFHTLDDAEKDGIDQSVSA